MVQVSTYTTKEVPFPHYGMRSYRIEFQTPDGVRWFQRHIWTDAQGVVIEEGWIPTHRPKPEYLATLDVVE